MPHCGKNNNVYGSFQAAAVSVQHVTCKLEFFFWGWGAHLAQTSEVGVHQAHVHLQVPKSAHHIKQMYKTL